MLKPDDLNLARNLLAVRVNGVRPLSKASKAKGYTHLIAEVCGGEARTTQLAIRQRHKAGSNFDLACDCDLTDEYQQNQALRTEYW